MLWRDRQRCLVWTADETFQPWFLHLLASWAFQYIQMHRWYWMILDDRIMMVVEQTERVSARLVFRPCILSCSLSCLPFQKGCVHHGLRTNRPSLVERRCIHGERRINFLKIHLHSIHDLTVCNPSWQTYECVWMWQLDGQWEFRECSPWWLSQLDKLKIHESTKTSHRCKRANARLQPHAFLTEKGQIFLSCFQVTFALMMLLSLLGSADLSWRCQPCHSAIAITIYPKSWSITKDTKIHRKIIW